MFLGLQWGGGSGHLLTGACFPFPFSLQETVDSRSFNWHPNFVRPRARFSYIRVNFGLFFYRQLEKVATHSGITRQHESSASATPNTPGRLISNRVFVGNIPPNLVERDLIMLFNRFGKIRDVKIIPEHARNKSYGFVTFFSEADARRAIQVIAMSLSWFIVMLCKSVYIL